MKLDKYNIACFISGEGNNMINIHLGGAEGRFRGEVKLVISDRSCIGINKAASMGIDSAIIRRFDNHELWNIILSNYCTLYKIDLICLAGFMKIIGEPLLSKYKNRILNIHPGTLPDLAGKDPQKKALELDYTWTGNNVHIVTDKVDDDSLILGRDVVYIAASETVESLSYKLKIKGYSTYIKAINNWINLVQKGELKV